mgnify:CR=1 FL=1
MCCLLSTMAESKVGEPYPHLAMSRLEHTLTSAAQVEEVETKLRSVSRVVTAHRQREGAGFIVRRPIGGEVSMVDPFLMLDHFVRARACNGYFVHTYIHGVA